MKQVVFNLVPAPDETSSRAISPRGIGNGSRTVVPILDDVDHIAKVLMSG